MIDPGFPLVLLVDDDPDHLFLAKQKLVREANVHVDTASSGPEALEASQKKNYSLVILDYNMPGMNGGEVLSRLLERDPEITAIMLTGGGSESLAVEMIKKGAYDYIVKSMDYLEALPSAVSRALQHRQLVEENRLLEQERAKLTKLSAVVETAITVNHEINNPLFAIKANTQLLQQRYTEKDPRLAKALDRILQSCERISDVTRKLANLVEPASREYAAGNSMLDINATPSAPEPVSPIPVSEPDEESEQMEDYLPVLWQIHNTLSYSLDLDRMLHEIALALMRIFKSCGCAIGMLEEKGTMLHIPQRYWQVPDGQMESVHYDIELALSSHDLLQEMIQTGVPVVSSPADPRINESERNILASLEIKSIIAVPMIHNGNTLGVIFVSRNDRPITHRESMLCQLITGQVSFALHNALQHNALMQRTEQLHAITSGWSGINSTLDLQKRLDALVELAAQLTGAHIAVIRLLQGNRLILGATHDQNPDRPFLPSYPADKGLSKIVLGSKEPVVIEDLQSDPRPSVRNSTNSLDLCSYMGARLEVRGQVIGIMGVFTQKRRNFTPEEVQTYAALADQAAVMIHMARLYEESMAKAEELSQKADQAQVKNEIVQAVLASNRIEDVGDFLVRNIPRLIPCNYAILTLADHTQHLHRVVASWSDHLNSLEIGEILDTEQTPLVRVSKRPRPVLIKDYRKIRAPHTITVRLIKDGYRSALLIPVCLGGDLVGSLCLMSTAPSVFQQEQIPQAQELADQAGIAIQNARLLQTISISKAEWEATFDAITDPVWVQRPDCTAIKLNRAAAEKAGVPLSKLAGECCIYGIHYEIDCDHCPVSRVIQQGQPITLEFQNSQGTFYSASVYPIHGEHKRLVALVSHVREVTDQKRVQKQLVDSAKLAAVGELSAGVAHNFNNLLTGVRGAIELLQMQAQRENFSLRVISRLGSIKDRLDQGDAVVSRLLSFARGSSETSSEIFLQMVAQDALAICETHSDRKGLEIRANVPEDLPPVSGIESHLQQVLVNLIINAFQATESGGYVELTGRRSSCPGYVELLVKDSGCGISPEDLPKIFESFYTKRMGDKIGTGTGLGLSVSRTMVEAMEGYLAAESIPGQGSTFTLRLPIYGKK